jgi:hypothetical protein
MFAGRGELVIRQLGTRERGEAADIWRTSTAASEARAAAKAGARKSSFPVSRTRCK